MKCTRFCCKQEQRRLKGAHLSELSNGAGREPSCLMFRYSSFEDEKALHESLAWYMMGLSVPTYVVLAHVVPSPWGKTLQDEHSGKAPSSSTTSSFWSVLLGPRISASLAWFLFESPNLVWSFVCYKQTESLPLTNSVLLALFVAHYTQRAIVYPLIISKNTKRMPLTVVVLALFFTSFNG